MLSFKHVFTNPSGELYVLSYAEYDTQDHNYVHCEKFLYNYCKNFINKKNTANPLRKIIPTKLRIFNKIDG